jgi:hypothetical protein
MRKILYSIFIITLLFIWSIILISCDAITAQNININSAGGMNGGTGINGGPDGNGNSGMNGGHGMNGGPGGNRN